MIRWKGEHSGRDANHRCLFHCLDRQESGKENPTNIIRIQDKQKRRGGESFQGQLTRSGVRKISRNGEKKKNEFICLKSGTKKKDIERNEEKVTTNGARKTNREGRR